MLHKNHDLTYCPVDLPRYEPEGEIENGFSEAYQSHIWSQDRLMPSYATDGLPYSHPREWYPEVVERFPRLVAYVKEHIPLRSICIAKILQSRNNLGFHVDIGKFDYPERDFYDHQYDHAPCAYRIVLGGQYRNVLYYASSTDVPREKWTWSQLPDETNVFVHSPVDSLHGTIYDPGIKRYILFIHGWLDVRRHYEIVERSRRKYADYAITFADLARNEA